MKNKSLPPVLLLFFGTLFLPKNGFSQCTPPIVTILPENPGFCPNGSVVLEAESEGATAFIWSNDATTPSITVSSDGSYSVTVTTTPGCSNSATVTVTAFPAPGIASISVFDNSGNFNDNKICHGSEVVLAANQTGTGTPPFSYQFTTSPTGHVSFIDANTSFTNSTWTNPTGSPVNVSLTNTITDANGCTGLLTVIVMANAQQGLTIERVDNSGTPNDGGYCFGDMANFISHPTGGTGVYGYSWNKNGSPFSTGPNISDAPPYDNGPGNDYTLTVTDDAGCTVANFTNAKGFTEIVVTALPQIVCEPGQQSLLINVTGGVPTPSGYLGRVNLPPNTFNFYDTPPAVTETISQPPGSTANYHIYMKDEKGCADSIDLLVAAPTELLAGAGADATVCNGISTQLNATANGGTGGKTYAWSPATGLSNPNIQNPVASPSSTTTYTVVATDAMGCTASDEVEITVLPVPEPGVSPANPVISCANPTVVLAATAAENWLWTTNETTQSITVSAPGTYFVTITDANGCTAVGSRTVTGNTAPSSANVSPATIELTCSNPTATLTATGGGTYLWTNGETNPVITVAESGTYIVTVTGANGCTATDFAVVTANIGGGTASITPTSFELNCTNTTVVLTASGGGTYLWSNGSTWYQITAGLAGSYSVTVTNPGGCTAVSSATITANYLTYYWDQDNDGYGPLNPSAAQTQQNCPQWVGTGWVLQAGDCAPENLTIYPGAPEICDGLDNDCDGQPETATVAAISPATVNLTCANPTATLTATGGGTYLWSNNSTNQAITVSLSGTYSVTVTGENGCTAIASATVTGNSGQPIAAISATNNFLNCTNTTSVLTASGGGTYLWSNGSNYHQITVGVAGTYSVTVSTGAGCTAVATKTITANYLTYYYDQDGDGFGNAAQTQQNCPQWISPGWVLQAGDCGPENPTVHPGAPEICDGLDNDCDGQVDETTLNLAIASSPVNCFGQNSTLTVSGTGGTPPYQYNFDWAGWQNGNSKSVAAGTHTVAIKDALGCIKQKNITQITPTVITSVMVNLLNNGKFKITVAASGGTPGYQFRRSNGGGWTSWQTSNIFNNVSAGTYTVQAKDSKNCQPFAAATVVCGGPPIAGGPGDREYLDQFDARREGDFARLQWLTETEPDDVFYEIERRANGSDFSKILTKMPDGSRTGAQFYEILDEKPMAGDNFYRLAIHQKDGEMRFSVIKKLNFGDLAELIWIYPNPADEQLFVHPRNLAGSSATLVLGDVLGREMRREIFGEMPEGPIFISIKDLPEGAYFLSFQTDESHLITRQVMVVHR